MAGIPADPWSAGIMALGGVASAASAPAGPSSAYSSASFDNSGWSVSIGGGTASSVKTALPTPGQTAQAVAAHTGALLSNPVVVIAAAVALFLYLKHK